MVHGTITVLWLVQTITYIIFNVHYHLQYCDSGVHYHITMVSVHYHIQYYG
jgi:hypothetical protein